MTPASFATRTLAPLAPLHGRGARNARLWALGGVLLAIPNLLVLRIWGVLADGAPQWRAFLVHLGEPLNLIAHAGYVCVALWGGYAAVRVWNRLSRARRMGRGALWSAVLGLALGAQVVARFGGVG